MDERSEIRWDARKGCGTLRRSGDFSVSSTHRTACAGAELPPQPGLLERFAALRAGSHPWLLDSALPSERLGRHSFAGADPYLVLRAFGGRVELDCRRSVRPDLAPGCSTRIGDPLEIARTLLPEPPDSVPSAPPFVGGAVGYLGYELAQTLEPLAFHTRDDLALPDIALLFVDRVLSFDHERGVLCAWALGFGENEERARAAARDNLAVFRGALDAPCEWAPQPTRAAASANEIAHGTDPAAYIKAVDRVLEEIVAGNVYQACLTHRMQSEYGGDAWSLYQRLRGANPAPFAAFIDLPELAILSSSPERFLQLDAQRVAESRPIKGTRPRGRGSEDAAFERELAGSAKDRAENLMIVDLVRNDLGRVCETGSISVPELMAIERRSSRWFRRCAAICAPTAMRSISCVRPSLRAR